MECNILENKKCNITGQYGNGHTGIDLVGDNRTLDYVIAFDSGKVIYCQDGYSNMKGSTGNTSYGNFVKISHGNGCFTLYAHMQKGLLVKDGEYVKKGQRLGYISDSGNAYGAHLHFELWVNNSRVNPIDYINKKEDTQGDTQETFYIVKQNDTLSKIANMYNTTYQKLADYNNIKNPDLIFVGQKIIIPSNCNKITYVVKSGDTLSSIANDYNTTWQKLYKDNIVVIGDNPNLIYPGQKLTINR